MVSTSRKVSRRLSKITKGSTPEETARIRKVGHHSLILHRDSKKQKIINLREEEKYDRLDKKITKEYGTKYIQNDPPHYWKCDCGAVTHGGIESKVGNMVIARCRHCDNTSTRTIKK